MDKIWYALISSVYSFEDMMAVRKTIDLFSRIKSTEQAELIATVLFSYDDLSKWKNNVSDKNIYDVLVWKTY